ncbi:MAG: DJ-1/PfpI family protein [Bacillota bacterium]
MQKRTIIFGLLLFTLLLLFLCGCRSRKENTPLPEDKTPPFKAETSAGKVDRLPEQPPVKEAKVLIVVAPSLFRDEEYQIPREILEENGYLVLVASATRETARGTNGLAVKPDLTLSEARGGDFAAVIFAGGPGAEEYFKDPEAHRLAREALSSGGVTGAICIAPGILAEADLLKGKKCTAYSSEKQHLRAKGAVYTGQDVVADGRIVTANGPQSAREFGEAISRLLKT